MNAIVIAVSAMTNDPIMAVFVPGIPRPQGSKSYMGGGRMRESSQYLPAWRRLVATRARAAFGRRDPIDEPVLLDVVFVLPARKNEPEPGGWHTVTPDLDKLVRAVGDALTEGRVLRDDARIAAIRATKRRARLNEPPGAHIHIDSLKRPHSASKEQP